MSHLLLRESGKRRTLLKIDRWIIIAHPKRRFRKERVPMALTSATAVPARLARTPDDYARLGIEPRAIKLWEDGMRTDGSPGTYEWWYFDAHLDDGAKLVVVFLTKEMIDLEKPLTPSIRIDLTLPDGTSVRKLTGLAA